MPPEGIRKHLTKGEKVVWYGTPVQGLRLARSDGLLIPFSLLWGGFAIFWETTVLQGRMPLVFALFGIPFVLVGLFLIFGRFLVDSWLRSRIVYALTDRRVLIARSAPWASVTAVGLDRLAGATLVEGRNGRGTIRFGADVPARRAMNGNAGFGAWVPALDPTPQFLGIEAAQRVFAAIQERSSGRA